MLFKFLFCIFLLNIIEVGVTSKHLSASDDANDVEESSTYEYLSASDYVEESSTYEHLSASDDEEESFTSEYLSASDDVEELSSSDDAEDLSSSDDVEGAVTFEVHPVKPKKPGKHFFRKKKNLRVKQLPLSADFKLFRDKGNNTVEDRPGFGDGNGTDSEPKRKKFYRKKKHLRLIFDINLYRGRVRRRRVQKPDNVTELESEKSLSALKETVKAQLSSKETSIGKGEAAITAKGLSASDNGLKRKVDGEEVEDLSVSIDVEDTATTEAPASEGSEKKKRKRKGLIGSLGGLLNNGLNGIGKGVKNIISNTLKEVGDIAGGITGGIAGLLGK